MYFFFFTVMERSRAALHTRAALHSATRLLSAVLGEDTPTAAVDTAAVRSAPQGWPQTVHSYHVDL